MYKKVLILFSLLMPITVLADETDDLINNAQQIFEATRIVCSGISDEIGKVANISKANTAVTAVGTVAAGGALAVGIAKSNEEKEIEKLIDEMCKSGGCTAEGVEAMSDEQFLLQVLQPMARIAELQQLQQKIDKSKKLGNWRTGLMAGTIGTNLASAIMSGINIDQSDLIQHISACNEMVKTIPNIEYELKKAGIGPMHTPVVKQLSNVRTWCDQININDIEKIEKRMKAVMGTSIAGGAIGIVGVGTSAAANSDKYMGLKNKTLLSEEDKKKEHALNTTANVMAGANTVAGAVETGLNISLITLTKKLMEQANRCEEVLQ
ncbi:MAG: hypothetical protein IKN73_01200 [Alphaproteobacteria bacterium]|nr:hypothetical protein [Alphaproteobacteria bacterium]